MNDNKLILSVAGSGKTTYLVKKALETPYSEKILITTYTEANEEEIRSKFIKINKYIPANITIQTWFSFLLQHGVRPFQGSLNEIMFEKDVESMILVNKQSGKRYVGINGPVYWSEKEFEKYYFTKSFNIYSDKISKFIIKCNDASSEAVINRISRIYDHIFVDEVQDLAGYDLEILKLLFASKTKILLVGDPRQITYLTHTERKYGKYKDGKIKEFFENELGNIIGCEIDEKTLIKSHRNNNEICKLSSQLYPEFEPSQPCECCCREEVGHKGVFIVKKCDVEHYLNKYNPIQLRWDRKTKVNENFGVMNFGESKGKTYDRVLIYPTQRMKDCIKDRSKCNDIKSGRAKFYVALTRAKYSASIVMDFEENESFDGAEKWKPN